MILLIACATAPDVELYARALDPATPVDEALAACADLRESSDECTTAVVADREVDPAVCQTLAAEWREECHFRVAERSERWDALVECGLSGRYYDECLYHLWSRELQDAVEPIQGAEVTRAVDHEAGAVEIVDYYAGLRNVRQDVRELLWDDFWYFAHARNRPARLSDCDDALDPARCLRGTTTFARRLVAEALIRASTDEDVRDRACRSGVIPEGITAGAWLADEVLDAAAQSGLESACLNPPVRPWNPIFVQPIRE